VNSPDFTPSTGEKAQQRAALLAALSLGPVSTVQAREDLGVLHPAGRVLELRRLGHFIDTVAGSRWDAQGRPHRVAVYVLHPKGGAS
jgi:hypothetical protein